MPKIENRQLISFLKNQQPSDAGFLDKLKIAYRPVICPFDDLLELIPEQSSVYDIGCGSGMFLSLVNEFRNPSKLGGVEISEELIRNANALLENESALPIDLRVFDGSEIPEVIFDFDFVVMIDVFHHIPRKNQLQFLEQLVGKMRSGATLIFKDIEGSSFLSFWNKFHDLLLAGEAGNEPRSTELVRFLNQLPLTLEHHSERRMWLYPHFTLVLKKL
ncbi:class I SAM-dependent methyltransferase [Halocola ammonii]